MTFREAPQTDRLITMKILIALVLPLVLLASAIAFAKISLTVHLPGRRVTAIPHGVRALHVG